MVRGPEKKMYPVILSNLGVLVKLGALKTPKMGSWSAGERFFSIAIGHLGADHQTLTISPFFAVRSLLLHCTARETDGGITDRVIDALAPFEGLALRHIDKVQYCTETINHVYLSKAVRRP